MRRVGVKTGTWAPSEAEWKDALGLIAACEPAESKRVCRFAFEEDRKRSLAGRLLARYVLAEETGVAFDLVPLRRTENNKPECPAFAGGFNISHHGDWVVLATHPKLPIGVDVVRYDEPKRGRAEFFASMRGQFTPQEWLTIGDSLCAFYHHWALKESLIKEMGIGLGFDLQRASFGFVGANQAQVCIDGVLDESRRFALHELDSSHCVAVCCADDLLFSGRFSYMSMPDLLELIHEKKKSARGNGR
jgi:4'-phosphopantetheinyl transferase